jgi:hypothetical protein
MKKYFYEADVTFESGDETTYFSHDVSDVVFMLGKWLNQRVVSWKIVRVHKADGFKETVLASDEGEGQ